MIAAAERVETLAEAAARAWHEDAARRAAKVDRTIEHVAPIFEWLRENVPEDCLVSTQFDPQGSPEAKVVAGTLADVETLVARLCRECGLKIEVRPSADAKRVDAMWALAPRDDGSGFWFWLWTSARDCRVVETGRMVTTETPERIIVCGEQEVPS